MVGHWTCISTGVSSTLCEQMTENEQHNEKNSNGKSASGSEASAKVGRLWCEEFVEK